MANFQPLKDALHAELEFLRETIENQKHRIQELESICGATFTCFPKLPMELREMVWRFTIEPRFVEIWEVSIPHRLDTKIWCGRCNETDPVPITSKVCRESRRIFLKEYCLYIPSGHRDYHLPNRPVYVNSSIDTVYLNIPCPWPRVGNTWESAVIRFCGYLNRRIEKEAGNDQRWAIKNLALNAEVFQWWGFYIQDDDPDAKFEERYIFRWFPGLEEALFLTTLTTCKGHRGGGQSIANPETENELLCWEEATKRLGWWKAIDDPIWPDYSDFMEINMNVAIRRETATKAVIDERDGLSVFGPMNLPVSAEWWEKSTREIGLAV